MELPIWQGPVSKGKYYPKNRIRNWFCPFMELPGAPSVLKKIWPAEFYTDVSKKAVISNFRCINCQKLAGQKSFLARFWPLCRKVAKPQLLRFAQKSNQGVVLRPSLGQVKILQAAALSSQNHLDPVPIVLAVFQKCQSGTRITPNMHGRIFIHKIWLPEAGLPCGRLHFNQKCGISRTRSKHT